jgi:hypothetical protein
VAVSSVAACSPSPTDLSGSKPLFSNPPVTPSVSPSAQASAPSVPAPLTGIPGAAAGGGVLVIPYAVGAGKPAPVGLGDADIVSLEFAEQGTLHIVGVFQSKYPSKVGPVGALRPSDLKLLNTVNPLIIQSGGTSGVLDTAKSFHLIVHSASKSSGFSASGSNYFANAGVLKSAAKGVPTPMFSYADSGQALSRLDVNPATKLVVTAPGHAAMTWTYDGAAKVWHAKIDGITATATNLVVMTTPYTTKHVSSLGKDLSFANPLGDGKAVVVSGDATIAATWHKRSFDYALNLLGPDSDLAQFAPGSTWILMAPTGSKVTTS